MLEQGCYTLINGGLSPSNTVYIDNVVDAIILAIEEDNAVGHALTISDNKTIIGELSSQVTQKCFLIHIQY